MSYHAAQPIFQYHNAMKKCATHGEPVDLDFAKEIHSCYRNYNSPHLARQYWLPDHLYVRDSEDVITCKESAADKAYETVLAALDKAAKEYENEEKDDDASFHSDDDSYYNISCGKQSKEEIYLAQFPPKHHLRKFANALPVCYPLTYHLMCRNWSKFCNEEAIMECPLCPNMEGWRIKRQLEEIIPDKCRCNYGKKKNTGRMNPNGILRHCESQKKLNIFHRIICEYLGYLQNNLFTRISCYVTKNCNKVFFDGKIPEMRHPPRHGHKVCLNPVAGDEGENTLVAKGPTSEKKLLQHLTKGRISVVTFLGKQVQCLLKKLRKPLIII